MKSKSQYLVIGARREGFFSNFLHTIDRMIYCDKHDLTPVINWETDNFLYADKSITESNCWKYYFENINNHNLDNIPDYDYTKEFTMPPYVEYSFRDIPHHQHIIDLNTFDSKREFVNKYISKIKIKKHIQEKINKFVDKNFKGYKVLGVHVRGTDKWADVPGGNQIHSRFENYDSLVLKEVESYDKILICTDSKRALLHFKKKYNNVVYYNSHRMINHTGDSIHFTRGSYSTGEDVLVESVLLSKCDKIIMTDSNVSLAALYFNPTIPFVYKSYEDLSIKNYGN